MNRLNHCLFWLSILLQFLSCDIYSLSQRYIHPSSELTFIYLYRSDCPYCQKFTPILQRYVKNHHHSLMAFEIHDPEVEPLLKAVWSDQQRRVPTVLVWNPNTQEVFPISEGYLSAMEFDQRMTQFLTTWSSYESEK